LKNIQDAIEQVNNNPSFGMKEKQEIVNNLLNTVNQSVKEAFLNSPHKA
jgi:hypothetical protein